MAIKKVIPKKTGSKTKKKTTPKASRSAVKTNSSKKTKVIKKKSTISKTPPLRGFSNKSFPIVGIGASAGGLEAFEDFFAHMDPATGMAFVVLTHQHPGHISLLPELLRKCTSMDVMQVTDQIKIKQNCVYLNPPGKNLSIFNGTIHISDPPEPRGLSLPIDFFFRSLAQDQKNKAICIILSGTGTDGTIGLRAIKGDSGMAMVQKESSAKFSGMPESAIATGLVDYILSPDKIPGRLIKYVRGPFLSPAAAIQRGKPQLEEVMQKIFLQLRNRTGHDFSGYKSNTTRRRIERRMNLHHINSPKKYLIYMQENLQEADALFKELLIGVTTFFRDTDAFKHLKGKIFPNLLKSKPKEAPLRVWVPACASGEEVYSLAILLNECQAKLKLHSNIQIFGTDLDPHAIDIARAGLYPSGIALDIPKNILDKYFKQEDSNYRIIKSIREMVIFAPQNVIKDPPFTKLDFISCRNLLIYLGADLQKKLLSIFHYSLKPSGILFLGNSESLGSSAHLFKSINKKWKTYSRTLVQPLLFSGGALNIFTSKSDKGLYQDVATTKNSDQQMPSIDIQTLMEKHLLSNFSPASVVVDDRGGVFYINGKTGDYLEPAPGKPDNNIFSMAREGLKVELSMALRKAYNQKNPVLLKDVEIKNNGGLITVNVMVQKIETPEPLQGLLLIVFEPQKKSGSVISNKKPGSKKLTVVSSSIVTKLQDELQYTKENLQSTIEELETTNEELKSTNEELQSTNEELQSSNEEIETSREEMQSLNEELQSTNTELQVTIDDFNIANDDMKNLLNSTNIATLFLDNDLNVKRFTSEAKNLINLISTDIGRPVSDIVTKLEYDKLTEDCTKVLKTLAFKEFESQTNDGLWYQIRIMPYRTSQNKINGLVITFVDINVLKNTERELQESGRLKLIVDSIPALVSYVDSKKVFRLTNKAYEKWYGLPQEEINGKHMKDILHPATYRNLEIHLKEVLKGKKVLFRTELPIAESGTRRVLCQYVPNFNAAGKTIGFFSIVTEFEEPDETGLFIDQS
ncbi:MAG: two-component system CheB/CheR fusion protein [Nitrospinales bacterium]|jgi:two-component system CheB/CheR fusion protein